MTSQNNSQSNQAFFILEIAERRLIDTEYSCTVECCDWLLDNEAFVVDAHFLKGCALYHSDDFSKAETEILNAIDFLPHNEDNVSNLLRTAIKASESPIDEILAYSKELFETSSAVNVLFGILLAKEGRLENAFSHFRKAKDISPNDPRLYINVGTAILSRENVTKNECMQAVCCLSRALKVLPTNRSALYNRCRAWIKIGVAQNALADSEALLFLYGDDPAFNYIHAKALLLANAYDEAKIYFAKAAKLAKDDYVKKEAVKQLNKLKRMKK